ncbi:MAG: selenoprotein [Armatimonadetes bacterium]|nr:selenoprotein [Armatimonadota bacterium]
MADQLLKTYKMQIASLEIVPGNGGIFDVQRDGTTIFSKHATGRFPEWSEIQAALA